jgi:hypothetical protein
MGEECNSDNTLDLNMESSTKQIWPVIVELIIPPTIG